MNGLKGPGERTGRTIGIIRDIAHFTAHFTAHSTTPDHCLNQQSIGLLTLG
ncbi:hypothetical protein [Streptomyces sp. NRRL F-525]|uniref:hypothetical protein n=1 Tax=Streptomyces sp. NRRL F-525 TaxID=1463861 RepID=UPI00131E9491|nr:hypothetical protein [Streptomyces sp. NRRL F-525]